MKSIVWISLKFTPFSDAHHWGVSEVCPYLICKVLYFCMRHSNPWPSQSSLLVQWCSSVSAPSIQSFEVCLSVHASEEPSHPERAEVPFKSLIPFPFSKVNEQPCQWCQWTKGADSSVTFSAKKYRLFLLSQAQSQIALCFCLLGLPWSNALFQIWAIACKVFETVAILISFLSSHLFSLGAAKLHCFDRQFHFLLLQASKGSSLRITWHLESVYVCLNIVFLKSQRFLQSKANRDFMLVPCCCFPFPSPIKS